MVEMRVVKMNGLKIRRALFTVSDKAGIVELAQAMVKTGTEIVATGKTARVLEDAGLRITPIEKISGSPEAFQGRMKTLSFNVCSGILYRRGDERDAQDLSKLAIQPMDCVVVNFYPFEAAAARAGITQKELIEEVDIGGPTLVRAAAKNSPDVLVLTSPDQYAPVIDSLKTNGSVEGVIVENAAKAAWDRILAYDQAIGERLGTRQTLPLRYGENPHQSGRLIFDSAGPIDWASGLTTQALSYNNILDITSAYNLACDLVTLGGQPRHSTGVVIVKHNNPCGVALLPSSAPGAQKEALLRAWEGDPVSAFGGVLVFTDPLEQDTAAWLAERFVEVVAAPGLVAGSPVMSTLVGKRKNLKAVTIRRFGESPREVTVSVPGGTLIQGGDIELEASFREVTDKKWPEEKMTLARFGIAVCRALKSNAIALVREIPTMRGAYQLVGAGQGQPNRIEALEKLAVPRAMTTLEKSLGGGKIEDCVMVSDAFFPFRDTVDGAARAGIRYIVQPGGSIKDAESIQACNENKVAMVFTGVRHFKH